MIGLGTGITTVAEFNRRAFIALRAVDLQGDFVSNCRQLFDAGRTLTKDQQQGMFNVVHRYRNAITDKALTEYAATKSKGYG